MAPDLQRHEEMATLTIDVPNELQERLQDVANQQGLRVEDLVRHALEALVVPPVTNGPDLRSLSRAERAKRIETVVAKYANLPGSVEEFLRSKHEDTEREEARYADRHSGGNKP
jgi:hypothetical protein